jgi:uncharacterized protein
MTRVFEHQNMWRLDESRVLSGARMLADAATEFFGRFTVVIGIGRGGWQPAAIIGESLHTRTVRVLARHNTSDELHLPGDGRVQVEAAVLERLPPTGQVLLVDDICGTGATLSTVYRLVLAQQRLSTVRAATLCRNVGSSVLPHLWVWSVSDWVVFPWETPPSAPMQLLPVADTVSLASGGLTLPDSVAGSLPESDGPSAAAPRRG